MKTIIWFSGGNVNSATRLMIDSLQRYARARDWRMLVLPNPRGDAAMRAELDFWRPDGVVANPSYSPATFGDLPVVIMSRRPEGYRGGAIFIEHDAVRTTALACEELLSLGYPDFAYVHALGDQDWSRQREAVFLRLIRKRGGRCRVFRSPAGDLADPGGFQRRLRRFIAELPKPCAVLAAHDEVGKYAVYAGNALGISIPGELAVCSIDNDEHVCLNTAPTLSSVLIDFARAGEMAGEAFAAAFAGAPTGTLSDSYGPLAVMRRGTTADFVRRDRTVVQAQEFIRRNAAAGAAEVAALFGGSARSAQLRFKSATGQSIMDAILDARLAAARQLLCDRSLTLDAVAQLSGFRTLRNFQHHFAKRCGISPARWRESRRT